MKSCQLEKFKALYVDVNIRFSKEKTHLTVKNQEG